jgi:hypothetical protein
MIPRSQFLRYMALLVSRTLDALRKYLAPARILVRWLTFFAQRCGGSDFG